MYDLPSTMKRSEADVVLQDLVSHGAQIHYLACDAPANITSHTVSSYQKISAIFPSSSVANYVYQQFCANVTTSSLFKLRFPGDSS